MKIASIVQNHLPSRKGRKVTPEKELDGGPTSRALDVRNPAWNLHRYERMDGISCCMRCLFKRQTKHAIT